MAGKRRSHRVTLEAVIAAQKAVMLAQQTADDLVVQFEEKVAALRPPRVMHRARVRHRKAKTSPKARETHNDKAAKEVLGSYRRVFAKKEVTKAKGKKKGKAISLDAPSRLSRAS